MKNHDNIAIVRRIEQRLTELGLSASGASQAAGLSRDAIRNWQRKPSLIPGGRSLLALAPVLGTSVQWLLSEEHTKQAKLPSTIITSESIRYGGILEDGAYRKPIVSGMQHVSTSVPVPADPRYPLNSQIAYQVASDSMDRAGIIAGMWVVAVDATDYQRLSGEIEDGQVVVVNQARNGEIERELSLKRLRIFRDRMEFRPESNNPVHKPIVLPNGTSGNEAFGSMVAALAIAAYIDFAPKPT